MAYALNGTNQAFTFNTAPTVSGEVTLSAKVWLQNTSTHVVLGLFNSGSDQRYSIYHDSNFGTALQFGAEGRQVNTTWSAQTSKFFDLIGTFSGLSSRTVSLDTTDVASALAATVLPTTNTVAIGVDARLGGTQFWVNGRLAEAAIWSVALTQDERRSLAAGFPPRRVRPQSLVFYAPLLRDVHDLRDARAYLTRGTPSVFAHPRRYG